MLYEMILLYFKLIKGQCNCNFCNQFKLYFKPDIYNLKTVIIYIVDIKMLTDSNFILPSIGHNHNNNTL